MKKHLLVLYVTLLFPGIFSVSAQQYYVGVPVFDTLGIGSYYSAGLCGTTTDVAITASGAMPYVTGLNLELHITGINVPGGLVQTNYGQILNAGDILLLPDDSSHVLIFSAAGNIDLALIAAGVPSLLNQSYYCSDFYFSHTLMQCENGGDFYPDALTQNCQVLCQTTASNFNFTVNGNTATFTNNSTNGNTYLWNFGDGNTSTAVNPVHQYGSTGVFNVTLITSNACVSDTVSSVITVTNIITHRAEFSKTINFLKLLPNPAGNHLKINYSAHSSGETLLLLYTIYGEVITAYKTEKDAGNLQIDLSGFSPGIYLSILMAGDEIIAKEKLVVVK